MSVKEAALTWARRMEWPVFPTRNKQPLVPRGVSWKAAASKDPTAIEAMAWEDANGYGVALPEDWLVVDLDVVRGESGTADLRPAMTALRREMPGAAQCISDGTAMMVETPSGGLHAYFRHDGSFELSQSRYENVDLRVGGKGYVIGPDSPGYRVVVWGKADVRHALNDLDAPMAQAAVPFLTARR